MATMPKNCPENLAKCKILEKDSVAIKCMDQILCKEDYCLNQFTESVPWYKNTIICWPDLEEA